MSNKPRHPRPPELVATATKGLVLMAIALFALLMIVKLLLAYGVL